MGQSSPLDLAAAWSRRAGTDLPAFLSALAARLDGALPGQVTVERARNGLFSSATHVRRIVVRTEGWQSELALQDGRARCRRARVVHGVALSSQEVPVADWLDALATDLRDQGERDGRGDAALEAFLLS